MHWLLYVILPIIHFKEGKTFAERLDLYNEDFTNMVVNTSKTNPELDEIILKIFRVFLIIFVVYSVPSTMYAVCYSIGKHQAALKDDYMIATNFNDYVLIYQDSNKYIFMPLKNKSSLSKEYIYVQTDTVDNFVLIPYIQKLSVCTNSCETAEKATETENPYKRKLP